MPSLFILHMSALWMDKSEAANTWIKRSGRSSAKSRKALSSLTWWRVCSTVDLLQHGFVDFPANCFETTTAEAV